MLRVHPSAMIQRVCNLVVYVQHNNVLCMLWCSACATVKCVCKNTLVSSLSASSPHACLCQTMLPAVLHARDRWLKPGGLIRPRHAHVSPSAGLIQGKIMRALSVPQHVVMHFLPLTPLPHLPSPSLFPFPPVSCAIPAARKCYFSEPCVEALTPENAMSLPAVICSIDCNNVKEEDLKVVTATFSCQSMVMGESKFLGLRILSSFHCTAVFVFGRLTKWNLRTNAPLGDALHILICLLQRVHCSTVLSGCHTGIQSRSFNPVQ